MIQILSWIIILIALPICLCSPFFVWWKLRKIRNSLVQENIKVESTMPSVPFLGSYYKGLSWVRRHQEELPDQLSSSVSQVLLANKLGLIALGFLFTVAAISIVVR